MPDSVVILEERSPPDAASPVPSAISRAQIMSGFQGAAASGTKRPRALSTIGFPYQDLEAAIGIAQTMIDAGGGALPRNQLAAVTTG
jgi:hypothetical protein